MQAERETRESQKKNQPAPPERERKKQTDSKAAGSRQHSKPVKTERKRQLEKGQRETYTPTKSSRSAETILRGERKQCVKQTQLTGRERDMEDLAG